MQPYFFPYIGYFQLINCVDTFVVYDNIQFTKKGWIQRNRILMNDSDRIFSLPIKKDSNYLNINDRFLIDDFQNEKEKLKRIFTNSYRKAPFFKEVFPVLIKILDFEDLNLYNYIFNSIKVLCGYLKIETRLVKSSDLEINIQDFKGQDKVIEICKSLNSTAYINPIGGVDLYDKKTFEEEGVTLSFLKTEDVLYEQFGNEFIPCLSIIDVMMFNPPEQVHAMLDDYEFI